MGVMFFLLFSAFICFSHAQCQIFLDSNGMDSASCGSAFQPCQSLSQAIKRLNATTAGCPYTTLYIFPGVYKGPLNRGVDYVFYGANLIIQPSNNLLNSITFDAENQSYILSLDIYNGSVSIQNIIFKSGRDRISKAGCLTINYRHSGSYYIQNSSFVDCTGFSAGGLYASSSYSSSVYACSFLDCVGDYGGGAALSGDVIHVINSTFTKNTAVLYGGGLSVKSSLVYLQLCKFINNTSTTGGGATITSSINIVSTDFENNIADGNGGGILISAANTISMSATTFGSNVAIMGGGIFIELSAPSTNLEFSDVIIYNNVAKNLGGGAYISEVTNVTINSLITEDNSAVSGGGLYIKSINNFKISDSAIRHNIVTNKGGGIACSSTNQVTATNNLFYENTASECAYFNLAIDTGTCPGIFLQCIQKQPISNCASCPITPHQPNSGITVGIVFGVIAGVAVVVGVVYLCRLKYVKSKSINYSPVK